jgi:guanylate kinase
MPGTLYIFSAPSGAGKTSLVKALIEQTTQIQVSVSHTTRAPRPGEVHGKDYWFTPIEDFKQMIDTQAFLEHAQVFDNFYGTSLETVSQTLAAGIDVILEIDWQGAQQVRRRVPNTLSVFILPPSMPELFSRLSGRGTDSAPVIERRMQQARDEMRHYHEYDYVIINDQFSQALEELKAIVSANRVTCAQQQIHHQALLKDLLTAQ